MLLLWPLLLLAAPLHSKPLHGGESSSISKAIASHDSLGLLVGGRLHKRRLDELLVPEPRRKVKNSKKKGGVNEDPNKPASLGPSRKAKKQGKVKKTNPIRQGQSAKRLRQHMQHKKKVKQFLQKRIQEQIEQRNPSVVTSI